MANRYKTQFLTTMAKGVTKIHARVTFGASGAPTLVTAGFVSQGIVSVTRNSAGVYTFVFGTSSSMLDVYYKLMGVSVLADTATAPAAPLYYLSANSVATVGTCSLQITFTNTSQTATDPGNGEAAYFEFTFKDSTAP